MTLFYQFLLGFIISTIVSLIAFFAKALSFSGGVTATLLGTIIIGTGPWYSILLAGAFFFSSGMIALFKKIRKQTTASLETRNFKQVLANLLPGACSLALFFQTKNEIFLLGYAASLASATADTWASEIGSLSKNPPRSILTFAPLPVGISGGISILGTLASISGSFFLSSLLYGLVTLTTFHFVSIHYFWLPFALGIVGSFVDSLLGAICQVVYRCEVCRKLTEKKHHHHKKTVYVKGWTWFTNNWTNFFTTSFITLLSWVVTYLIS